MTVRTERWPAGTPCWADVMCRDVRASGAFYREVLGWDVPEPDEQWGGYVVATVGDHAVAGLGPLQDGAPPAWTLYLATDDVGATVEQMGGRGGSVLAPPTDVGGMGRMAIVRDPTGAALGLWEAGTMIGAEHVGAPGGLTWEDLRTPDPDAARAFYGGVFAFEFAAVEMAGADYATFALPGDEPLGGIGPMMGAPEGTPPHWLCYFGVADTDAALATASAHGGTAVAPPFDTPYGRMGALTDPDGAVFWVVQLPDA